MTAGREASAEDQAEARAQSVLPDLLKLKLCVACRRMHLSVHYHHDDPSDEGTLDGRPKSSRRPAGG